VTRPRGGVRLAALILTFSSVFMVPPLATRGASSTPDLFRTTRPLSAPAGWDRLVLPDDVLDQCRPGVPDLRIFDAAGTEVPWALEERVERGVRGTARPHPLLDVERTPGRETTALVDRGPRPPLARAATLEIDGSDWLKPVTLEASDDRTAWAVIARGSVFATRSARSTTIRFPANDRRWWRIRFDDRNGDPVVPRSVRVESDDPTEPRREIPLSVSAAGDSRPTAILPASNLGVRTLRIEGGAPTYSRRVRVWERVFFRDELLRLLIGEDVISRAPDGTGTQEVSICEPTGRELEIEVERMDGPELAISRVVALAQPRAILFAAPAGALRLAYGSSLVDAPRYDVERALAIARPREISPATLGPVTPPTRAPGAPETGAAGFPDPARGAALDPSRWKWRQPIALPAGGNVAYLDLAAVAGRGEGTPRILDEKNRQVPYVVERAAHRERRLVTARVSQRETRTVVEIPDLVAPSDVDAFEISASAPAFFSRQATVVEQEFDARGAAGTRVLGTASWEKRAEEEARPLTIAVARPATRSVRIEIENGDNASLTIGPVVVWTSVPRIDFVYRPGEQLTLVTGSVDALAPAPRYDLELVATRVLAAPALQAKLAARPVPATPEKTRGPRWLWIPVVAAALLVALVLARTLRGSSGGASSPPSPPPSSPEE